MSKTHRAKNKSQKNLPAPITLLPSTNIALDRLVLSNDNVRHIKNGVSIDQLADSIARRSLLQSLSVRPALDEDGKENGTYAVQGGGRRFTALKLLVKQKRLAPDAEVPCIIKTTGTIEDDSLAENTDRENLHPLDEFRAFLAMRIKGMPEDDIAAAYHVTTAVVRQRLKLASASPVLLKAYADDELTLEQLMAFCITDDHKRQTTIWDAIQKNQIHPQPNNIRRALTETSVRADDPRVRFITIDAYKKAGGSVMRDLFAEQDDKGSYLQDPALLARLVSEKLEAARLDAVAQGWKWAEAAVDIPYQNKQGLTRLKPTKCSLSREEQKQLNVLTEEYDALVDQFDDNNSDEFSDELNRKTDALQEEIDRRSNPTPVFKKKDMARGGVFIELGQDGSLDIDYGYVRNEDRLAADMADDADDTLGDDIDHHDSGEEIQPPCNGGLPDRLVQDLSSYRTVALRNCLAQDFTTAFRTVIYTLCLSHFDFHGERSCLQITSNESFPAVAPDLDETPSAKSITERHERWTARMPEFASGLWDMIDNLSLDEQHDLFAHCVSLTLNAVREPHRSRSKEIQHANHLAEVLNLDMNREGWSPTVENYFSRVTKAQIIDAVREARDESTVHMISDFKKPTMAKEAARLLEGTGWLPHPLRPTTPSNGQGADDEPAAKLPAFLAAGDGDGLAEAAE